MTYANSVSQGLRHQISPNADFPQIGRKLSFKNLLKVILFLSRTQQPLSQTQLLSCCLKTWSLEPRQHPKGEGCPWLCCPWALAKHQSPPMCPVSGWHISVSQCQWLDGEDLPTALEVHIISSIWHLRNLWCGLHNQPRIQGRAEQS